MAIKVRLHNPSQITKNKLLSTDSSIVLNRINYQMLGSLVKNKTLASDYDNGLLPGEYKRFLDDLSALHVVRNYPLLGTDIVLKDGIEELDTYLGSLGNTEEYPYEKDSVNVAPWVGLSYTPTQRYLIDKSSDEEVVLMDGDAVLVRIV